jgi:hypothetical protein
MTDMARGKSHIAGRVPAVAGGRRGGEIVEVR